MGTNLSFRRVAKLLIGVAAASAVLVIALFAMKVIALWIQNGEPFSSDRWRAGDVRVRGQMVDDLDESGILVGKTREQVIQLLGPPDTNEPGMLAYTVDLGHKFGENPWYYSLFIGLGSEGSVQKVLVAD